MPRKAKLSLDPTHPLYKAGVHRYPFSTVTYDGKDWATIKKEDTILVELDQLETDTKAVLYSRSPLSITAEIGGDFSFPERERYQRLFDHFAPQLWKLTVLNAQLNKRPLPGTIVELNPHLALLRTAFFELGTSDHNSDAMDYRLAIERGVFSYIKWLPTIEFQTTRQRFSQRVARQQKRTKEGLEFLEERSNNRHLMTLVLGYEEERKDIEQVLADKNTVVQVANFAFNHAKRYYLKNTALNFQFFIRLCYSPTYGHYWVLVAPTPNEATAKFIEQEVVKKWTASLSHLGFCARLPLAEPTYTAVKEYLDFQIAKEGLVHTDVDRDTHRIYHTN